MILIVFVGIVMFTEALRIVNIGGWKDGKCCFIPYLSMPPCKGYKMPPDEPYIRARPVFALLVKSLLVKLSTTILSTAELILKHLYLLKCY